jgi:C-terminal processing protease CtpA/Prc
MAKAMVGTLPLARTEYSKPASNGVQAAFGQKVYVLVDRDCAWACERTLEVLERLPGRVLVGENSAGAVEYGNPGKVRLPKSHIVVQLATMSRHFSDGRHPENTGYAPDVRVEQGRDALDTALRLIAKAR